MWAIKIVFIIFYTQGKISPHTIKLFLAFSLSDYQRSLSCIYISLVVFVVFHERLISVIFVTMKYKYMYPFLFYLQTRS
jgi:hypothetical protein